MSAETDEFTRRRKGNEITDFEYELSALVNKHASSKLYVAEVVGILIIEAIQVALESLEDDE